MFYYNHAWVWFVRSYYTHTDTSQYYSRGLYILRCLYNLPKLWVPLLWHTPAECEMNRLLQEVMRRASSMWSVCWLCWTSLLLLGSTRGMMHYRKEDGISTSTLNTFRKKLLCRCLVLVFTTVRFQSAMLGKCFSFS